MYHFVDVRRLRGVVRHTRQNGEPVRTRAVTNPWRLLYSHEFAVSVLLFSDRNVSAIFIPPPSAPPPYNAETRIRAWLTAREVRTKRPPNRRAVLDIPDERLSRRSPKCTIVSRASNNGSLPISLRKKKPVDDDFAHEPCRVWIYTRRDMSDCPGRQRFSLRLTGMSAAITNVLANTAVESANETSSKRAA